MRLHQIFADRINSAIYPKKTLAALQTGTLHPRAAARMHHPDGLFWAEAITNFTLDAPRRRVYGPTFVRIQEGFQRWAVPAAPPHGGRAGSSTEEEQ